MLLVCHLGKGLQLVQGAGGAQGALQTPNDLQTTLAAGFDISEAYNWLVRHVVSIVADTMSTIAICCQTNQCPWRYRLAGV